MFLRLNLILSGIKLDRTFDAFPGLSAIDKVDGDILVAPKGRDEAETKPFG